MVIKRPDWGIWCFFSGKIVVTFLGGPPTSTARSWTSSRTWLPVIHGQEATKPKRLTSQKFMVRISKIWSPKKAGVFFPSCYSFKERGVHIDQQKGRTWKIFYPQKCQISNERSSVCLVYIGIYYPPGWKPTCSHISCGQVAIAHLHSFDGVYCKKNNFLSNFLWWPQNHW